MVHELLALLQRLQRADVLASFTRSFWAQAAPNEALEGPARRVELACRVLITAKVPCLKNQALLWSKWLVRIFSGVSLKTSAVQRLSAPSEFSIAERLGSRAFSVEMPRPTLLSVSSGHAVAHFSAESRACCRVASERYLQTSSRVRMLLSSHTAFPPLWPSHGPECRPSAKSAPWHPFSPGDGSNCALPSNKVSTGEKATVSKTCCNRKSQQHGGVCSPGTCSGTKRSTFAEHRGCRGGTVSID